MIYLLLLVTQYEGSDIIGAYETNELALEQANRYEDSRPLCSDQQLIIKEMFVETRQSVETVNPTYAYDPKED